MAHPAKRLVIQARAGKEAADAALTEARAQLQTASGALAEARAQREAAVAALAQAKAQAVGAEVRLVLDAAPHLVIPAKTTFVSDVAQFTPKTVETKVEREKLMFRIKAHIPPTC